MAKLVIYNDVDYHGDFYTVYMDGKCLGAYLSDDVELKHMIQKHAPNVEFKCGIDTREDI